MRVKDYIAKEQLHSLANLMWKAMNPKKMQGIIPIFLIHIINRQPITIFVVGETERDDIYLQDLVDALLSLSEYTGMNIFSM